MRIVTIYLARLRNEEHFQVMSDVDRIVLRYPASELAMSGTLGEFKMALAAERTAIEYMRTQAPTSPISAAAECLRKAFKGLVFSIKRYDNRQLYPDKQLALEKLMIVVNHYKKLVYRGMGERRASVENFIKDLREQCEQAIEDLEIEQWITQLDLANKELYSLLEQRNNRKETVRQKSNMRQCRKATDEAFRKLRFCIEAALAENKVTDGEKLQAEMNATLRYHKSLLSMRSSKRITYNEIDGE